MLALCPQDTFLGIRNRAILLMFMDTGVRLVEISTIQRTHINKEYDLILINGKGAKQRFVPLGKTAQKALLKYINLFRSDPADVIPNLWLTEERRPMGRYGIQIMVRRLIRLAGITGVKIGNSDLDIIFLPSTGKTHYREYLRLLSTSPYVFPLAPIKYRAGYIWCSYFEVGFQQLYQP